MDEATKARLRAIADGLDDVADAVNTTMMDRYIEELRTLAGED